MRPEAKSNERIQFGCGLTAPPSWRNFDASPTLRAQRLPGIGAMMRRIGTRFPASAEYGDVTRRLPVADGSARLVYCSHVLEHLALDDMRAALAESFRVLRPGGTFRMVLPDLEALIDSYRSSSSETAAINFIRDTLMGQEHRPAGLAGRARELFGNARHRWLWDYRALAAELIAAGFTGIRRAAFGDNPDPSFAEVEEEERWTGALGIECIRP